MSILKNSSVPRIVKIEKIAASDITTLPGTKAGRVKVSTSESWEEIYFTPGSAELKSEKQSGVKGVVYESVLTFDHPGDTSSQAEAIIHLEYELDGSAIRITYDDDSVRLMGTENFPSLLSDSFQINKKQSGYTFKVVWEYEHKPLIVE